MKKIDSKVAVLAITVALFGSMVLYMSSMVGKQKEMIAAMQAQVEDVTARMDAFETSTNVLTRTITNEVVVVKEPESLLKRAATKLLE